MVRTAIAERAHWFLDLDGTLVDSHAAHGEAFAFSLAEEAPELCAGFDYGQYRGRPTDEVFASLGISDEARRGFLVRRKQWHYRRLVERGQVKPFPGAETLLTTLARTGRLAYVVTSASAGSANAILGGLGLDHLLAGTVTGDDVAVGKPDSACYERAIALFSPDRRQAVAVEDSPAGVAAALAAELPVFQVHTTPHLDGAIAIHGLSDIVAALTRRERNE